MVDLSGYTVRAVRWDGGWELYILDGGGQEVGVTQSHSLGDAERMVRDYLAISGAGDAGFALEFDIGGLETEVAAAHREAAAAAAAQAAAAARSRSVVSALKAKGLSGADIGKVMGLSRGRVSQLTKT